MIITFIEFVTDTHNYLAYLYYSELMTCVLLLVYEALAFKGVASRL